MGDKINVLFMQSQTYFGADSLVHALLMRYFDRSRVNLHVACNIGLRDAHSPAFAALQRVPNLHIRPTLFGTSVNSLSPQQIIKNTLISSLPTVVDLGRLVNYIRRHEIDIIHCTEKPRDAFYGLLLARASGARCVIHLHVKAEGWISPLVRWAMRHADALVGVSDFVRESIIALGYPAEKTFSVLNSLDTSGWDPNLSGAAVRQEFGIAPDTPVLAVVSRLFVWKGHTELIKALAQVKQHVPNFKLLLVGEDDPRAMPDRRSYSAELKQLTADLGLNEHVVFTGFRKDIPMILAASDIFAMPSFEEPFGMVYLEAMAMNKPIIALDNGGAREVVEHEKCGLLSLPQDIDQLAQNIVALLTQPALRIAMGRYGYQRVKGFFHPRRMANDMEQLYRQILQRSNHSMMPENSFTGVGS